MINNPDLDVNSWFFFHIIMFSIFRLFSSDEMNFVRAVCVLFASHCKSSLAKQSIAALIYSSNCLCTANISHTCVLLFWKDVSTLFNFHKTYIFLISHIVILLYLKGLIFGCSFFLKTFHMNATLTLLFSWSFITNFPWIFCCQVLFYFLLPRELFTTLNVSNNFEH